MPSAKIYYYDIIQIKKKEQSAFFELNEILQHSSNVIKDNQFDLKIFMEQIFPSMFKYM